MKKAILLLFMIGSFVNTISSQDCYSIHKIDFYKNNRKVNFDISEVKIIVDGIEVLGKEVDDEIIFPIIDSLATFYLYVESNKIEFVSGPYEAWRLNNGSRVSLGRINHISKLLSVAEYNDLSTEDDGYEIFGSRFFIVNDLYTIDIENHDKVKSLEYLILNPKQEGDGSYVITQTITKLRKK